MHKIILYLILISSMLINSPGQSFALRPPAAANVKQLLSKAMAKYSYLLWLDFLKARRDKISREIARFIEERARAKATVTTPEGSHSIPEPENMYSLNSLVKIRDAYSDRRESLNVLELMEFFSLSKMLSERIRFFGGVRRGKEEMSECNFEKAFSFAFAGTTRENVRAILTDRGKMVYFAEDSPYQIIVDIGGGYFRVLDTSLKLSHTKKRGIRQYTTSGEGGIQYKGPYLSSAFRRIPLKIITSAKGKKRKKSQFSPTDEEYESITHFKFLGTPPLPVQHFSGNDVLTLRQAADILRFRMGIKDIQLCYSTELQKKGLLRPEEWHIEILEEDKIARVYPGKKWLSFIQQLYKLREIIPELESGTAPEIDQALVQKARQNKAKVSARKGRTIHYIDIQTGYGRAIDLYADTESIDNPDLVLHILCYRNNANINALVQSPQAVTQGIISSGQTLLPITPSYVADLKERDPLPLIDEVFREDFNVAVARAIKEHNAVLTRYNVVITAGSTLIEAYNRNSLIEDTAKITAAAKIMGKAPWPIPKEQIDKILKFITTRESGGYKAKKAVKVEYRMKEIAIARKKLVAIGKQISEKGLVTDPGGNISVRIGDIILIKAGGKYLTDIRPEEYVGVDLRTGLPVAGLGAERLMSSSETELHLAVYRTRPDVTAVVHAHPSFATGMATAHVEEKKVMIIPVLPYMLSGTDELTEATSKEIANSDLLLLANHGSLTVGKSTSAPGSLKAAIEGLEDVFKLTLRLEQEATYMVNRRAALLNATAEAILSEGPNFPSAHTEDRLTEHKFSTAIARSA